MFARNNSMCKERQLQINKTWAQMSIVANVLASKLGNQDAPLIKIGTNMLGI